MNITLRLARLAIVGLVAVLASAATSASAQTLEWVRPVGTGTSDKAIAVTVDTAGNVYVGGSTSGTFVGESTAGGADAFVAKFDSAGEMIWVRQFGTAGSDSISGTDTDAAGFLYAAGSAGAEALLVKYDSTGSQQWVRQLSVTGFGTVGVSGMAADPDGNTYLLAFATDQVTPPPVAGPRWFVTKYNADGEREWVQWSQSATLIPNTCYDIETDEAGHVFVACVSRAPSPSSFDSAFVVELDPAGNRVGGAAYAAGVHSYIYDVAVDALGNLYASGYFASPRTGSSGYFLFRNDAAGTRVWEQPLTGSTADLAADARGSYVAVYNVLALHDVSGSRSWETSVISNIVNVDVAKSGDIYLVMEGAYLAKVTQPPITGFYEIVSRNSDKCLDVYSASMDAVAPVIQWMCHGGGNQQWALEPAGGGAFRIIARHSGQALDVYGAWLDDLSPAIQYPWHGGDNQLWTLEPTSDGYVRIVARHSGKVLDVEGGALYDGAQVIQYSWHGGANQQWLLRPVAVHP